MLVVPSPNSSKAADDPGKAFRSFPTCTLLAKWYSPTLATQRLGLAVFNQCCESVQPINGGCEKRQMLILLELVFTISTETSNLQTITCRLHPRKPSLCRCAGQRMECGVRLHYLSQKSWSASREQRFGRAQCSVGDRSIEICTMYGAWPES